MQLALADLLQVFLKGHPAIHDHRGPKLFAGPLLQHIQHLIHAGPVLRIAVEDFVGFGEAITIQDQSHHHLFGIRTLVPRVSALGLWVGRGLPFEVRRRQVIQIDGVVQIEQRLFLRRQRPSIDRTSSSTDTPRATGAVTDLSMTRTRDLENQTTASRQCDFGLLGDRFPCLTARGISGSAQAYSVPPLATRTYCRPSSSYVMGEFVTCPIRECQRVFPSAVRRARTFPSESPVKVNPESVVKTPALAPPPRSCDQRTFPV